MGTTSKKAIKAKPKAKPKINAKEWEKKRRLATVLLALFVVGSATLLIWHLWQQKYHPSAAAIAACEQKLERKESGMTDVDTSSCDPSIKLYSTLSSAQKVTSERNQQIQSNAVKSKNTSKCDDIKGTTYQAYPAGLEKVMPISEDAAKIECRAVVQSAIGEANFTQNKEDHTHTLPGWGIKLLWNDDRSDQLRFYPTNIGPDGTPKSYELTTQKTESEQLCSSEAARLVAITRTLDVNQAKGKGALLQTKVGNYYYYDASPTHECTPSSDNAKAQLTQEKILIDSMLTGIPTLSS